MTWIGKSSKLALGVSLAALSFACRPTQTAPDIERTVQARVQATSQVLATVIASEVRLTPRPVPVIATPAATATAKAITTSSPTALLAQVDHAWAAEDWPAAIKTLIDLRALAPDDADYKGKLYAAYINSADKLVVSGDKSQAVSQLRKAAELDPSHGEATSRQLALTPTPVPPAATATPTAPPGLQQYVSYMVPLVEQASAGIDSILSSQLVQAQIDAISKDKTVEDLDRQLQRDQLLAKDVTVSAQNRAAALQDAYQTKLALPHAQVVALDADNKLRALNDSTKQKTMAVALAQIENATQRMQNTSPVPPELERLNSLMVSFDNDLAYISDEYIAGVDTPNSTRLANALQRMQTMSAKTKTILSEANTMADRYGIQTGG